MNRFERTVDIRPDDLQVVRQILREHLPPDVKVWVFGSRANGVARIASDLDLALECDSAIDHSQIGVLQDAFEDSDLPYTVDVIDISRVNARFRQIVIAHRIPFPMFKHQRTDT